MLSPRFIFVLSTERKYRNFHEIRIALEDGEIDGALLDTYVAAEHKEEIFNENIYVKEILDRPFGYGVVLSGAARNVEQRCRDYIDTHIRTIFDIIQNTTKTLDVSLCVRTSLLQKNVNKIVIRFFACIKVQNVLGEGSVPEGILDLHRFAAWKANILLLQSTGPLKHLL